MRILFTKNSPCKKGLMLWYCHMAFGIRHSAFGIRTYQWNRFKIPLFRIDGNIGRLNNMRLQFFKIKIESDSNRFILAFVCMNNNHIDELWFLLVFYVHNQMRQHCLIVQCLLGLYFCTMAVLRLHLPFNSIFICYLKCLIHRNPLFSISVVVQWNFWWRIISQTFFGAPLRIVSFQYTINDLYADDFENFSIYSVSVYVDFYVYLCT